jgi:hypothetical protein
MDLSTIQHRQLTLLELLHTNSKSVFPLVLFRVMEFQWPLQSLLDLVSYTDLICSE